MRGVRRTKLFRAQTTPRRCRLGATNECARRRACHADLAAAAFVAFRLVSMRLLRALCFPSIVIGLTA